MQSHNFPLSVAGVTLSSMLLCTAGDKWRMTALIWTWLPFICCWLFTPRSALPQELHVQSGNPSDRNAPTAEWREEGRSRSSNRCNECFQSLVPLAEEFICSLSQSIISTITRSSFGSAKAHLSVFFLFGPSLPWMSSPLSLSTLCWEQEVTQFGRRCKWVGVEHIDVYYRGKNHLLQSC